MKLDSSPKKSVLLSLTTLVVFFMSLILHMSCDAQVSNDSTHTASSAAYDFQQRSIIDFKANPKEPFGMPIIATKVLKKNLESALNHELSQLVEFDRQSKDLANSSPTDLRSKMDSVLLGLDSMAVEKNLNSAELILDTISNVQKNSFNTAIAATQLSQKGLWIAWSEKLLYTQNALKHFFSDLVLQRFEKAIDANRTSEFEPLIEQLRKTIHRDHERRLVAMLRRQEKGTAAFQAIIDILSISGGPLARLNIYQRFITEPSLQLAQAMAKAGIPRITDLLGENIHLSDGLPYVPNTRTRTQENALSQTLGNLKLQWQEMKVYLDDLTKIPLRFERARSKWLEIHQQIEFLINLLSIDDAHKESLKKEILQSYVSKEVTSELIYRRGGIEFREGDIILIQTSPIGGLWETFTQSGSHLSHLLMVTFGEDGLPYTIEMNFGRLLIAPLDLHTDRYTVVRLRNITPEKRKAIRTAFTKLLLKDITYDFRFNSKSSSSLYCSELPAAVLKLAELNENPVAFEPASTSAKEILLAAGISQPTFFTQGSYLSSNDFEVVGQGLDSDPREFIRGQVVLEAFTKHIAEAYKIRLFKHPESHQIWTLAALAQTTTPDIRRALGPQHFLFTVMTLDKLIHAIESDTLKVQTQAEGRHSHLSRISELKSALLESLKTVIPRHLASIFPREE